MRHLSKSSIIGLSLALLVILALVSSVLHRYERHLATIALMEVLEEALAEGDDSSALDLIRRGAYVDRLLPTGGTPLMAAALHGRVDLVKALLQAGADVDARSEGGSTALVRAASGAQIMSRLEAEAVASGSGFFVVPTDTRHTEVIRLLLLHGANPDLAGAYTALQYAARGGDLEAVQVLLEYGADVNRRGGHEATPLILAVLEGHIEVVRELLEAGANPALRYIDRTAIEWAQNLQEQDRVESAVADEIIRLLLER